MYLSADKIGYALRIASKVLKHPKISDENGPRLPISVDDLLIVVAEMSEHTITGREVEFDAEHLKGRVERFNNKTATVDVRLSIADLRLMRLVAAKEAMHLLVDQDEDMTPYGDQTLERLVEDGHIGVLTNEKGQASASQSELIAEIAAQEVLWPLPLRVGDMKQRNQPKFTTGMSEKYELPPFIVSSMISGSYAEFMKTAFEQHVQNEQNA